MIAHAYVNRKILTNEDCLSGYVNEGYVTRGADWYELTGGMQDYGYLNYGTIEVTMEISCCKYPVSNSLENYWNYNRDAIIEYLYQAQRGLIFLNKKKISQSFIFLGVKGLILNEYSEAIPSTAVMINDRRPVVNVTALGEFWRILLPGTYTLKVIQIIDFIGLIKYILGTLSWLCNLSSNNHN